MTNFGLKLSKHVDPKVFTIAKSQTFDLPEISLETSYTLKCTGIKGSDVYIIRPCVMKEMTDYSIRGHLAKDCDYIIIDCTKKNIIYLELKSRGGISNRHTINQQLQAGKKWFNHLLFLLDIDDFSSFEEYFVCGRVNTRPMPKVQYKKNKYGFYINQGEKFDIRHFLNSVSNKN